MNDIDESHIILGVPYNASAPEIRQALRGHLSQCRGKTPQDGARRQLLRKAAEDMCAQALRRTQHHLDLRGVLPEVKRADTTPESTFNKMKRWVYYCLGY